MTRAILRLALAALTAFSTLSLTAQTEVNPYQPGLTKEGITYFLPTTAVRVVVTARRTTYLPGDYYQYAKRYLRLSDVTTERYDRWQVTNVTLEPFGVPDRSRAYTIKLKSKTTAPLVGMTDNGLLLSINSNSPAPKMALTGPSVTPDNTPKLNPDDYKTEEILSAGSKAKMAELTAAEIFDIRENRSALTKGQADYMPKDGEQLRLMLASLDTQEKALMQLFTGTTQSETHVWTFDVTPTESGKAIPLFALSTYLGKVDSDDPAGETFYLSATQLDTPTQPTPEAQKKEKEAEDLRYIVPAQAELKVYTAERTYADLKTGLAQWGRVEHLGGELFNKKASTHVTLSPVTGGILKIDAEQPN